ncbi:MAG: hypothetical protein EZS28_014309, partial [Streblomastix strix]
MTNISQRNEERKDRFYLETLALPGEIQSMVVGRFFDRNIESLILAKSTFLSVFHNNDLEDSFDFVDHICVYQEIYCLCVSVQPHCLDCLFVLSIGGEWLLLQWNKTRFFPLASGSLLKAIQPLMKTPEQRRFRLDPTFQWAVSVVPITDNSPRFFTRPTPILGSEYTSGATKPIIRISFRALIVVDETVFVGVKYDGPDANFLQVIKDNWSVTLQHFPKKFGFFDPDNKNGYKEENINTTIRNGLETEWKALFTVDQVKKNICIAKADTFLFFENDKDRPNFNELKKKKKVRHLVFTTSMRLEPFPIKKNPYIMPSFPYSEPLGRERDGEVAGPGLSTTENRGRIQLPKYVPQIRSLTKIKHGTKRSDAQQIPTNSQQEQDDSNLSCATGIALVDAPAGLSALSLLFNFELHRISLHSFVIAALPPSISRIMPVIDENRVIKTLKGENIQLMNRVSSGDVNIVKSAFAKANDFLNQYYSDNATTDNENVINYPSTETSNYFKSIPNNTISLVQNAASNDSFQHHSNALQETITKLHKHIIQQQYLNNTFIITFPNHSLHKQHQQIQDYEEYRSDDDSQYSSSTSIHSSENSDQIRLTLNGEQLDNQDSHILNRIILNVRKEAKGNETIPNFHPFLVFTSLNVILFTSHLTTLKFNYPTPFTQPPMCVLYVAGLDQDSNQQSEQTPNSALDQEQKKLRRHNEQNDTKSSDNLFIASGRALIIVCNGKVDYHYYPFRWFNELVMTNGANWYFSSRSQQHMKHLSIQSESQIDEETSSSQFTNSSSSSNDINKRCLNIGVQMLFVISASNSSMIVDLNSGSFYDFPGQESQLRQLGEGNPEDFQYNPMCVNSMVHIPYYSFSPYHSVEDRFVLGVGNGRTGALHRIGLGHKLQMITQGKLFSELPTLFTTRSYSGAALHSLVLVQEEKIAEYKQKQQQHDLNSKNQREFQQQSQSFQQPYTSSVFLGENLYRTYTSTLFAVHEDVLEPIDSKEICIDLRTKTLALAGAHGALVQVTTQEVLIIPTVRFFSQQINQQQEDQIQQQNNQLLNSSISSQDENKKQNINYNQFEIKSEFTGYQYNQTISWKKPTLLTEQQCHYRISNLETRIKTQSLSPNHDESINKSISTAQSLMFEHACITDNMIAVSYKCIVFVLIWNPSIPRIAYSEQDSSQTTGGKTQVKQHGASVHTVSTLCFPSTVNSLSASTICTRSFLIVGCESPPAVFLFRLDAVQVAQQTEVSRMQLWNEGEKRLQKLKYQLTHPTVQRPNADLVIQNGLRNQVNDCNMNDRPTIRIGEGNDCQILCSDSDIDLPLGLVRQRSTLKPIRFIEVQSGSHQFVEVKYSLKATMTQLFDLYPYDRPQQLLLTTFGGKVRIFSEQELKANDLNPFIDKSPLDKADESQTPILGQEYDKRRNYLNNDGAVLMVTG